MIYDFACVKGVYRGEKGHATDVRDEVHAEEPVHRTGCLEERAEGNGDTDYSRTSVPG